MRYGIYGGAFDPIHLGHLLLAESALRAGRLDRIVFVPTGISPHHHGKDVYRASGEDRLRMIEAAITGCDEFLVSRFEIDRPEPSFTVETVRYFRKTFALVEPEWFLVLGADMFNDLPGWRETEELCRLATPLVAARSGCPPPHFASLSGFVSPDRLDAIRSNVVSMPQIELSSTRIRAAVTARESIRFQVPRTVEAYIAAHGLYRKPVGETSPEPAD